MNLRHKLFNFVFLFIVTTAAQAQNATKKYIRKYECLAAEKAERHGIPASLILGISIVESAAGKSLICKSLNNFFGIKGKNRSSQKRMGYKSSYKEYATDEESFEHFCQVIMKKSFYTKLKGSTDYAQWLRRMNIASYAAAKQKWIDHIALTITKYKLYKLDEGRQISLR